MSTDINYIVLLGMRGLWLINLNRLRIDNVILGQSLLGWLDEGRVNWGCHTVIIYLNTNFSNTIQAIIHFTTATTIPLFCTGSLILRLFETGLYKIFMLI